MQLNSPISRMSLFPHLVTPNLVNILPKSNRTDTLRIFKNKMDEEKRFEKHNIDSPKLKQDATGIEIKRADKGKVVEIMADKSKVNYNKHKYHKPLGSMYVNDLWGKKYEILVRKTAQIDVEINNREDLKRKPLQVKLDEAMDYLNQKFLASGNEVPIFPENTDEIIPSNILNPTTGENVEKKIHHRSVSLPKINISRKNSRTSIRVADEVLQSLSKRDSFASPPENKVKAQVPPLKIALPTLENKTVNPKIYPLSTRNAQTNFEDETPKKKINPRLRKVLNEKKMILDSLMSKCDSEIQKQASFHTAIKDFENVLAKEVIKTKPSYSEVIKNKLIKECKYTLEMKRIRQKKTASMS